MHIDRLSTIADITRAEFNALDKSAGGAACYDRVSQREHDQRWSASYIRCTDGDRLLAMVPLYTCRSARWPDAAYDPSRWGFADEQDVLGHPGRCLMVGSYSDLRSGLHVAEAARAAGALRRILAEVALVASEQNRCLIFPYVFPQARQALRMAAPEEISWRPLAEEATFTGVADPAWLERQRSRVRGVWRRDQRLINSSGVTSSVCPWPEAQECASDLIAAHNIRKGRADHPEFARMRYGLWEECPEIELVVLRAAAGDITGVVTALIWEAELELYEIGLTGADSPDRLAVYLELLFHRPVALARSHGLRNIRAGLEASAPKASRGAVFQSLAGGLVTAEQVRKLADGRF